MYGDIGHGIILTIAAFVLILCEKSMIRQRARGEMNEIISMVFDGRYMLLMMGLFAVYAGTIYNDVFSIPTAVFDSGYEQKPNLTNEWQLASRPYPYGLDPIWAEKTNELQFYNSFKMKMSVSLGVTQMVFGIILSLCNHVYFGDRVSAYFEFVPRMIFILSVFGYMVSRESRLEVAECSC